MNQNTLHSTGEVNHLQIVLMREELNQGSGLLYNGLRYVLFNILSWRKQCTLVFIDRISNIYTQTCNGTTDKINRTSTDLKDSQNYNLLWVIFKKNKMAISWTKMGKIWNTRAFCFKVLLLAFLVEIWPFC